MARIHLYFREETDMAEQLFSRHAFEASLTLKALRDRDFRQELLRDPVAIYGREANHQVPDGVEIRVVIEQPNVFYLVLPHLPDEALTEAQLKAVAARELTHREPCWGIGDGLDRTLTQEAQARLTSTIDPKAQRGGAAVLP